MVKKMVEMMKRRSVANWVVLLSVLLLGGAVAYQGWLSSEVRELNAIEDELCQPGLPITGASGTLYYDDHEDRVLLREND